MNNMNNINICCQKTLKRNIMILSNNYTGVSYKNSVQCNECGRILDLTCKAREDEIIDLSANEGVLVTENGKDGIKL